ncbi:MAG: PQQ-dependent sugar dehydrogenase [Pseudomonadota bacterium]
MNRKSLTFGLLLTMAASTPALADVDKLSLPAGFSIQALNFAVDNARQMALTEKGTLVVGTRRKGKVYAIPHALTDDNPVVVELFDDLTMPSGIAVHDGDLYIGALNEVIKVADIDSHLEEEPPHQVLVDDLPDKTHHGWKYLKVGPDGYLYVPVGAPCNVCLSKDKRFASLLRMDTQTGENEIWAQGIRNTVGFAWHPDTQALWFSDNGRDMMGDDVPHEEINVITRKGQHFGYPFVHADGVDDPKFGDHKDRKHHTFEYPVLNIQAHSAALGLDFYTADHFPEEYSNALFIAEHGSWNRSSKVGYQVSVAKVDATGQLNYEPFIQGWLVGQSPWGRPNDVLVAPDGTLLISDDAKGLIYRVSYAG